MRPRWVKPVSDTKTLQMRIIRIWHGVGGVACGGWPAPPYRWGGWGRRDRAAVTVAPRTILFLFFYKLIYHPPHANLQQRPD